MKLNRMLCLLLSLIMMLSLLSGCGGGTDTLPETQTGYQDTVDDEEIKKAIDLGFVPESLQGDYDAQLSYAEFCGILDNFISFMFPEALSSWKNVSENYRDADDLMSRMEGALVFLYAAECCGMDSVGYEYTSLLSARIADNVNPLEGVTWDYSLLPDIYERYYDGAIANSEAWGWRCELGYDENAQLFVEQLSYGNGKSYFDYDEHFSMNYGEAFSRGDAIRAVERLYETSRFVQYVPVNEISCTVSEDAMELGSKLPNVSFEQLPAWNGYTVASRIGNAGYGMGMLYEKEEIDVICSYGFDFVRVPLDSRTIFSGSDTSMVNPAYLETMDNLVEYCAEAGIHICFDLHDMPGFYTDGEDSQITLWTDEETQTLFEEIWRFLAEYYKDVPSNLLSFNLLNEPHDPEGGPSDDVYSEIMLRAIHAIREVSPERLIFVDMLGSVWGSPVQGLADAQVVQTIHPYFMKDGDTWPAYVMNGFVHIDNGTLTLTGDFPAGTTVTADINSAHGKSEFSWQADGKTISAMTLGCEAVGENGCVAIDEAGTDGEYRMYEGTSFTGTLPNACSRIALIQENGCWYGLNSLSIQTPDFSIVITADSEAVPDETVPTLSVSASGEVLAQNGDTLICKSREWLESKFASYQEFTEETGTPIMVQEFGFNETIDNQTALSAMDDFLSVLEAYHIPWCSWHSYFGPLADSREIQWREKVWNIPAVRDGGNYKMVSEHWQIDIGLMEVYQKYMN